MQMGNTDWVKFILDRLIWFIILGVFLFFTIWAENFLTPLNMINITLHTSVLALMVIGQAICLLSGNFDLSAEGTVALLTVLAAWLMGTVSGAGVAHTFEAGSGWGINPIRVGESTLFLGTGFTLETVAASVIGGIALSGGYGTIVGAFAGVLLLAVVDNGLNLMQMNPNAVRGVRGLIILVALIIEAQKFRYTPKSARPKQSQAKNQIPASSR